MSMFAYYLRISHCTSVRMATTLYMEYLHKKRKEKETDLKKNLKMQKYTNISTTIFLFIYHATNTLIRL